LICGEGAVGGGVRGERAPWAASDGGRMKRRGNLIVAAVLLLVIVGVSALLMREATHGTTFRAAEHATLQECMQNIPREWLPGSLERTRAEAACHHEHDRRLRQP
jgi:hypothetical protein